MRNYYSWEIIYLLIALYSNFELLVNILNRKDEETMATQKILDRNYKIEEGGVVTIVETTQKQLNKAELQAQKIQLLNRQTQLLNQSTELQKQSKVIDESIKEIDEMITRLDLLGGGGGQNGDK